MTILKLKVGRAEYDDIGRDIVRIHRDDRRPAEVNRHDIIRLSVGAKSIVVAMRGNDTPGIINIDIDLREELGLSVGGTYDFELRKVGKVGQFLWQWNATDPAVRLPAQIAIVSFCLGLIGLALGVVSIWPK